MSDTFTVRQRANGNYVGQCRLCAAKEVHGEAAWAERLISLHVEQEHTTTEAHVQGAVEDFLERGKHLENSEALLAGVITSLLLQYRSEDVGVSITSVEPILDTDGYYSNMVRVAMGSGTTLIVHVTETE